MTETTPQAAFWSWSFSMNRSSLISILTRKLDAKDCSTSLRLSCRRLIDILLLNSVQTDQRENSSSVLLASKTHFLPSCVWQKPPRRLGVGRSQLFDPGALRLW